VSRAGQQVESRVKGELEESRWKQLKPDAEQSFIIGSLGHLLLCFALLRTLVVAADCAWGAWASMASFEAHDTSECTLFQARPKTSN